MNSPTGLSLSLSSYNCRPCLYHPCLCLQPQLFVLSAFQMNTKLDLKENHALIFIISLFNDLTLFDLSLDSNNIMKHVGKLY